jgi:hypothetical protein
MKPLAEWQPEVKLLTVKDFCSLHIDPFLIHCESSGILRPVDQTRGLTMDRAIIADQHVNHAWSPALVDYKAVEVRAKDPECNEITIGCSSRCDIQLNDMTVSKHHAIFVRSQAGWVVRDASSLTGTRVNDIEPGSEPLCSGDRISFGVADLIFMMPREVYMLIKGLDRCLK